MFKKLSALVMLLMIFPYVAHAGALKEGKEFPALKLNGNLTEPQKQYLGITGDGPWELKDIDSDYLLIEIFSMYCPHCQKEAPVINELYNNMLDRKEKIKLVGIGVGNSQFETNFFKEKYSVDFPLFADPDMAIHEATGSTGTPYFYLVRISGDTPMTIQSHEGRIDAPDSFMKKMNDAISNP